MITNAQEYQESVIEQTNSVWQDMRNLFFKLRESYQEVNGMFSRDNQEKINNLLNIIEKKINNNEECTEVFDFSALSSSFAQIVEIWEHNFFNRQIIEFQGILCMIRYEIKILVDEIPQISMVQIYNQIKKQLYEIIQLSLTITLGKPSEDNVIIVRNMLESLKKLIIEFSDSGVTKKDPRIIGFIAQIGNLESSIKSIMGFIYTNIYVKDFGKLLKINQKNDLGLLPSIVTRVIPKRMSTDLTISRHLSNIINIFEKEKRLDITQFRIIFWETLKKSNFESMFLGYVDIIIDIIINMNSPDDSSMKVFKMCQQFYMASSNLFIQYYQMPIKISSRNDILEFILSIKRLKESADELLRARKKPNNWTADTTRQVLSRLNSLYEFEVLLDNVLVLIMKANSIVKKDEFYIQIKSNDITNRFVWSDNNKISSEKIYCIAAMIRIKKDLISLSNNNVILKREGDKKALFVSSLAYIIKQIRQEALGIECQIITKFLISNNENDYKKYLDIMIPIFNFINRLDHRFILNLQNVPLEISYIKELSSILYSNGVSDSIELSISSISRNLKGFNDLNNVLYKMENSGFITKSCGRQIFYLCTQCHELLSYDSSFMELYNFFSQIDLFSVDKMLIIQKCGELSELTRTKYQSFSSLVFYFEGFVESLEYFNQHKKEIIGLQFEPFLGVLVKMIQDGVGKKNSKNFFHEIYALAVCIKQSMRESHLSASFINHLRSLCEYIFDFCDKQRHKALMKRLNKYFGRIDFGNYVLSDIKPKKLNTVVTSHENNVYCEMPNDKILCREFYSSVENQKVKGFCINSNDLSISFQYFSSIILSSLFLHWNPKNLKMYDNEKLLLMSMNSKEISESLLHQIKEKIIISLEQQIERLIKILNDHMEQNLNNSLKDTLYIASKLNDIIKGLNKARSKLKGQSFEWMPEIAEAYHHSYSMFRESDLISTHIHPILALRSFVMSMFTFFSFSRLICFLNNEPIHIGPDIYILFIHLRLVLYSNGYILENMKNNVQFFDDVLKFDEIQSYEKFSNQLQLLRPSLSFFNIKLMVGYIDFGFFDLSAFFRSIGTHVGSLSYFSLSSICSNFLQNYSLTRELIINDFSPYYINSILYKRLKLKEEVGTYDIEQNWESGDFSLRTILLFRSLIDTSLIFDEIYPVFSNDKLDYVTSYEIIRIISLIYVIQNNIVSINISNDSPMNRIVSQFAKVVMSMKAIPLKFGLMNKEQKMFKIFIEQWNNFIGVINANQFDNEILSFQKELLIFLNLIDDHNLASDARADVKLFNINFQTFILENSKESFLRLLFSIHFVDNQRSRFFPNNTHVLSERLHQASANVLMLFLLKEIVPTVSKYLSDSFDITITDVEIQMQREVENHIPTEDTVNIIENAMSFNDQTVLSQLVSSYFDANMVDEENLVLNSHINETSHLLSNTVEHCESVQRYLSSMYSLCQEKSKDKIPAQSLETAPLHEDIDIHSLLNASDPFGPLIECQKRISSIGFSGCNPSQNENKLIELSKKIAAVSKCEEVTKVILEQCV